LAQILRSGELSKELTIIKSDMNESEIKIIKGLIFDGIEKSKTLTEICSFIIDESEKRFRGYWNCIVFKIHLGSFSTRKKPSKFLVCYISDFYFIVFQSPD